MRPPPPLDGAVCAVAEPCCHARAKETPESLVIGSDIDHGISPPEA